jgi:polysaccharide biosynthesis protein PslJ
MLAAPRRLPLTLILVLAAVLAAAAVLGVLAGVATELVVPVAAGILLIALAIADLTLIPTLAVPATLVLTRVGGALSVSDVVLALAAVVAMLLIRNRGAMTMQPMLWAGAIYLAAAIPTLVLNPYSANAIEWVHELFLVIGSMVVGFVAGREGKARLALGLYLVACCGIGIAAAIYTATAFLHSGDFAPAYLPELHKNTIGGMLAAAFVIAFARPVWLHLRRRWAYLAMALCALGLAASQSRQGLVGALIGVLFVALRPRPQSGKRAKWVWLLSIPVAAYVITQVQSQLGSSNQFDSAHQRIAWYSDALHVWQQSPVFGVGLRWWYTDRFSVAFQPPNAELEVLSSVGVIGLIGFLLMFAVALWLLIRMNPIYGTVGAAVVLTRFTQAQFDLYWVAGQASLLWIVVGICYGVQALDRARAREQAEADAAPAVPTLPGVAPR